MKGFALSAKTATRGCASDLVHVTMDVADSMSIEAAVGSVKAAYALHFQGNKLAVLVKILNNAGISQSVAIEAMSDERVCMCMIPLFETWFLLSGCLSLRTRSNSSHC